MEPSRKHLPKLTMISLPKFKVSEFLMFKWLIFICINFLFLGKGLGQDPDTYDQLNSNTSAAFVLLGISPTEIARPTSIGDLAGSLQSATGNFSSLPNTYALEMSLDPNSKDTDITKRTLSFAYINESDPFVQSRISFGFKYSVAENEDSAQSKQAIKLAKNKVKNGLNVNQVNALRNAKGYNLLDKSDFVNANMGVAKVDKKGAFLDIHCGTSFKIRDNSFKSMYLDRLGAWLNFGYEEVNDSDTKVSLYGTMKVIYQKISVDEQPILKVRGVTNIDPGTRLVIIGFDRRLEISTEALWRIRHKMKSTYKIGTQFSLDIGNNKKLSFSFGRDFDRLIEKEGNLFTLLNFISSFNNN